jgi:hypothetical protein
MSKLFSSNGNSGNNTHTNNNNAQLDNYEAETVEDIPEQFDLSRYKKISKMHQQNQQQQQQQNTQQQQQQSHQFRSQQPQILSSSNFGYPVGQPAYFTSNGNAMFPGNKIMNHPIMSSGIFGSQYGPNPMGFLPQQQMFNLNQQPFLSMDMYQFRNNGMPPPPAQPFVQHQANFVPHQHTQQQQQQQQPQQVGAKNVPQHHNHQQHHAHQASHQYHHVSQPNDSMKQQHQHQQQQHQEPSSGQGYYKDSLAGSQGYSSVSNKKKNMYSGWYCDLNSGGNFCWGPNQSPL